MIDPNGNETWVVEKLVEEHIAMGYKLCPNCTPRMSYAIPAWVPTDEEQEVFLVLDDFNRCIPLFMQAIMALVQFGEYISWKLPKNTHLFLTSNIDDGSMNVSSMDAAQTSRMLTFRLDFDHKLYATWMDNLDLKSEAINFMLMNPEIFEQSDRVNARTYTMFANAISGIKDFGSSLGDVDLIARGCFGDETTIGALFATFVHNNLDKLLSAEDILGGKWEDTSKKILDCVIKDGLYRADIASVLTMRLVNYIARLDESKPTPKKLDAIFERLECIISCKSGTMLTEDLILALLKKMNMKYKPRVQKMLIKRPDILMKLVD